MPWSGGVFTRPTNSFSQPVLGTEIDRTDADTTFDAWDAALGQAASGAVGQVYRLVTSAGAVTVGSTDLIILLNKTVGAATSIVLPTSASRGGMPITIKDIKGDANTNNITFTLAGVETIDGSNQAASDANGNSKIDINYGKKTLYPLLSGGWYL